MLNVMPRCWVVFLAPDWLISLNIDKCHVADVDYGQCRVILKG